MSGNPLGSYGGSGTGGGSGFGVDYWEQYWQQYYENGGGMGYGGGGDGGYYGGGYYGGGYYGGGYYGGGDGGYYGPGAGGGVGGDVIGQFEFAAVEDVSYVLNSITCVRDGSRYCLLEAAVDEFLYEELPKMQRENAAAAEEGSRLFCEDPCVSALAPVILEAEEDAFWRANRLYFEKGCYEEEGEYCLGRFLRNGSHPKAELVAACDGEVNKKIANNSQCPAACLLALRNVSAAWGCCLGEHGDDVRLVTQAAALCSEQVFKCDGGGRITFQLDVPNLRYVWASDSWRTVLGRRLLRLAVATDVGTAVSLPDAQVALEGLLSFAGGATLRMEIVTQTVLQSERVMRRLQGLARRAFLLVDMSTLANAIDRAALVDPRQGLVGEVDVISIVAEGSAQRFCREDVPQCRGLDPAFAAAPPRSASNLPLLLCAAAAAVLPATSILERIGAWT